MTHIKCSHCSLINWPNTETCERCGAQLERSQPETHVEESVRHDLPILTYGSDVSTGSKVLKLVVAVVIVLVVGGAAWGFWYKRGTGSRRNGSEAKKQFVPPTLEERTRDEMLACLAQPGFVGSKLGEQVLGRFKLELLQVPDREVYFSTPVPEKVGQEFESMIVPFLIDPKRIVKAEDDGTGRLRLGKYSLLRSDDKHFFFKTPTVSRMQFEFWKQIRRERWLISTFA